MRVFVAGATGVLGRALLPQLQAAGHETFGLARTPEKMLRVERMGAKAARGDVLDAEGMRRLLAETQPEAVINLATVIPLKLHINPKDWEANDRVRVEGARNLLAGAREAGVRLFLQESVGYLCKPQEDRWIDEDCARADIEFLRATAQMEDLTRASGVPATLMRLAALASADSWHTQQSIAALRRGLLPIIGRGDSYISAIHAEDAASALLCALANPEAAAGQTFHVADDAPAPMREVFPYVARLLKAPAPRSVPPFVAKAMVGALTVDVLAASYRMSNAKIRRMLGFAPRYPTYRESWAQIVQAIAGRDFAPAEDLT